MGKHLVSMIAVALSLTSLTMGCTIKLAPSTIPRLDAKTEGLAGPFNNISVTLVNVQADDANFSVKDANGKNTGWVANRRLWTEKLAEALETELTARQAKVVGGAPVTISLKITTVDYRAGRAGGYIIRFDVTANAASSSGWTKTYIGVGSTSALVPAGVKKDSNWTRAANAAIRDVVLAIMSDPEFIAELRKQK